MDQSREAHLRQARSIEGGQLYSRSSRTMSVQALCRPQVAQVTGERQGCNILESQRNAAAPA
jgi:hypothetical protein